MTQAKEFKVVQILTETQVVIAAGTREGIKVGDRFDIVGIGKELSHPETGENLGRVELPRGTGQVVHAQEKMAIVESNVIDAKPIKIERTQGSGGPFGILIGPGTTTREEISKERRPYVSPQIGDIARLRIRLNVA